MSVAPLCEPLQADPSAGNAYEATPDCASEELAVNEAKILAELTAAQGRPVELGGYFRPNPELTSKAMRPSPTFNAIVDAVS